MNRIKFTPLPRGADLWTMIRITLRDIDRHHAKIHDQMPKTPVRKKGKR